MSAPAITDDAAGITPARNGRVGSAVEQLLAPAPAAVEQVPMSLLNPSPDNPADRMSVDVDDIAASITSVGIIEPLIVARAAAWQAHDDRLPYLTAGEFVVIAGHRRLAGARKAYPDPQEPLPCIVRDDLVGADADVAMVVENAQRKDLTPIEEARAYQRLVDQHGKSQRDIAKLVGKTQPHVSKRLALLNLPDDVQAKAGTDELSIEDAVALSKLDDPKAVKDVLRRPSWQTLEAAVDAAHEAKVRAERLAETKKRLTAQGVQHVITLGPRDYLTSYGTPRALRYLAADGVDVDDHEHCECHGVAVEVLRGGEVQTTPVCRNPKTHEGSRDNKNADATRRAKEKAEREAKAVEKRHQVRIDVIKSACVKVDADTERAVLMTELGRVLSDTFDRDDLEVLAGVLGDLTLPPDDEGPESRLRTFATEVAAVLDYAAASTAALKRCYTAAVLLWEAQDAERCWCRDPGKEAFLEWLAARGHKLAGPEKAALKRAKGN